MPVYKVWNNDRTAKKFVVASSLEDLKRKGQIKLTLKPCTHIIDLRLVLESDGTLVDEDEILEELKVETFMLLEPGDVWQSSSVATMSNEAFTDSGLSCNSPQITDLSMSKTCMPSGEERDAAKSLTCSQICLPLASPASPCQELSSHKSSKNFTVPLPKLSSYVHECLAGGRILDCLNNLVSECAHFYLNSYELTSSMQYKEVGEQLFRKYPCIKFPKGTEPWSLFCEKLSQKLRNMRFQRRRKSGDVSAKSPKQPRFGRMTMSQMTSLECISQEDYNKHLRELSEETKKPNPDKAHIKLLLKETFKMRREWLSTQPMASWTPLMKAYPCLEDMEQIIFEYQLLRGHNTVEQEHSNIQEVFTIVEKLMEKKPQGSNAMKSLQVLQYMEKNTAFEKGKGKKTESVIAIKKDVPEDDIDKKCSSKELSPPSLVCFIHNENVSEVVIVGDGQKIFCHTDDIKLAILYMLYIYYVTDLEYPRQLSQILGLLQQYVIKEQFNCSVSLKFRKFCAVLDKELDKESSV